MVIGGRGLRREYPARPIVGVGAVIMHEGRLLLVKRGVEPAKGKWSIPGGVVELGEGVRDAVVREVREECGLDIEIVTDTPMDALDSLVTDEGGRLKYHYVLLQFLARPRGGTLKPASDVLEARWVPLEEVETYDITKSLRRFLKKHRHELERFTSS
jgi:ADP-ribose pyrophosphatase YjhB (NUDIX family)